MQIITNHMQTIPHDKILNRTPPEIDITEQALPHYTRRLLAQFRTNKSPILLAYQHKFTLESHRSTPYATHNHMTQDTYLAVQGCRRTWAPRRNGAIPERAWRGDEGGEACCRPPLGRQQQH